MDGLTAPRWYKTSEKDGFANTAFTSSTDVLARLIVRFVFARAKREIVQNQLSSIERSSERERQRERERERERERARAYLSLSVSVPPVPPLPPLLLSVFPLLPFLCSPPLPVKILFIGIIHRERHTIRGVKESPWLLYQARNKQQKANNKQQTKNHRLCTEHEGRAQQCCYIACGGTGSAVSSENVRAMTSVSGVSITSSSVCLKSVEQGGVVRCWRNKGKGDRASSKAGSSND